MTLEITWPPKFVRLCKIAEATDPIVPATAPAEYRYGTATNEGSLPTLYSVDGWLLRLPLPGEPVRVLRFARNDVIWPGLYTSSEVVGVPREGEFFTVNSIYHWQEIAAPAAPLL